MYIRAATRKNFTTSLFTTTALIAVFTVAAPQLMPCPVSNGLANDEKEQTQTQAQAQTQTQKGQKE